MAPRPIHPVASPLLGVAIFVAQAAVSVRGEEARQAPDLIDISVGGDAERSVLVEPQDLADSAPISEPSASSSQAEELLDTIRPQHAWAKFEPGAWRRLRIVSETFDQAGRLDGRSVVERTERLLAVAEDSYQLEIEEVVEIAGRRTPGQPEQRNFWIATDRPLSFGQPTVELGETSSISLAGKMVPCQSWRVIQPAPGGSEEDEIYVAKDTSPAILRRERQAMVDGQQSSRFVQSVTRTQAPARYGPFLAAGWFTNESIVRPDGQRSEQLTLCSLDAPGGLHWRSLAEYGPEGEPLRWAVTELVASGRTAGEEILMNPTSAEQPEPPTRPRRLLRFLRRQAVDPPNKAADPGRTDPNEGA